jgi:WD40 repeat protein
VNETKALKPISSKLPKNVSTAQWHPRKPSVASIAFVASDYDREPSIQLFDTGAEANNAIGNYTFKMPDVDMVGVVVASIVWNPGENSFLAVMSEGSIFLFAEEYPTPKMYYEKQNTGVAEAVWLDNISGDFLTCSKKVGALRIWNASSPTPKRIIKVSNFGICNVVPTFTNNFLL